MTLIKNKIKEEDNVKKAYQYLADKGLPAHLAAGIIGNLQQESYLHLDSTVENKIGAVGIAQWLGVRRKNLESFAKKQGSDYKDFDTQLDFLWKELTTTGDGWNKTRHKDAFFNAESAEEAASIFVDHFERSGEKPGEKGYDRRLKYANNIYERFTGNEKKSSDGTKVRDERLDGIAVVDNTSVDTPDIQGLDLENQNDRLLQKVSDWQDQQDAKDKYSQAQASLQQKKKQKDFLQEMIANSGMQYVERTKRPSYLEQGQGVPEYQDGATHGTDPRELTVKKQDNTRVGRPTMRPELLEMDETYYDTLPEIVLTHDKSEYQESQDNRWKKPLNKDFEKFLIEDERKLTEIDSESTAAPIREMSTEDLKEEPRMSQEELKEFITDENRAPAQIEMKELDKVEASSVDISDLQKLDSVEITKLQKELEAKGYLKPNYERISLPSDSEGVREVQKMLVSKKFDLGKYGEKGDGVDGLAGAMTYKAIEKYNKEASGIDGVSGSNTEDALRAYKGDQFRESLDPQEVATRFVELESDEDLVGYQENLEKQGYFKGIDFEAADDKDIVTRKTKNSFKANTDTKAKDPRCTWYVGKEIEKMVKESGRESIDAYGDAWTITDRLVNKGAEVVFSVFEDEKPNLGSGEIEPYLKERISQAGAFDTENVKSGDLVNLFYEGSSSKDKAYTKGGKYFTSHTGIVKMGKEGKLVVEHNVGGKISQESLESLSQGKGRNAAGKMLAVSAITRPDYQMANHDEEAEFSDSTRAYINTDKVRNFKNLGSRNAAVFTQTIIKNQEALMGDIPINKSEFDLLTKATKTVGWKESGFSSNVDSPQGVGVHSTKKKLGEFRELVGGTELSRGMTQMKDEKNLSPNLRKKYIKNQGQNLNNPAESAIPSFYAMSSRYIYLRDLAVKNKLSVTPEELSKLSVVAWNQPLHIVGETLLKNKGYNKTMEAYRGEDGKMSYDLALTGFDEYLQ